MQSLDTTLSALEGESRLAQLARSGPDRERVERFRTRFLPELERDGRAMAALDALSGLRCPVLLVAEDAGLARLCATALHDAHAHTGGHFEVLDGALLDTAAELDARLLASVPGTLLIERLEHMPLLVQSRLLSLLLEGELERANEKDRLRLKPRLLLTLAQDRDGLVRSGKLHPELSRVLGRTEIRLAKGVEGSP
jgi:hypothetical protein